MEILFVASFPGSIVSFRGDLMKALMDMGHSVSVAAPGLSDSDDRLAVEQIGATAIDVPLNRTGTSPLMDLALLLRLVGVMRRRRPGAVFCYTAKPVIYGSIAAWLTRVQRRFVLVTGLGYAFTGDRRGLLASLVPRLYRIALKRSTKAFFQNSDDRILLESKGILSKSTPAVVVDGSGINTSRFPYVSPPAENPSFLLIARLLGDKGVREYAHAAKAVRSRYPDIRFCLAGWIDGNPDAISRDELAKWIDSDTVEFLGRLSDVRTALADCSVYVLPSYREGTPRTVLEAMSTGRAIITTDAPGCRETVSDGDNGFLVAPRSSAAVADAMIRFIEDPSLVESMGRRSRAIAEQRYDVTKVNSCIIDEMDL